MGITHVAGVLSYIQYQKLHAYILIETCIIVLLLELYFQCIKILLQNESMTYF